MNGHEPEDIGAEGMQFVQAAGYSAESTLLRERAREDLVDGSRLEPFGRDAGGRILTKAERDDE
jgi:hypothetical protein